MKTLLIFTLFLPFFFFSQEKEYIVTNNNDTIYGKVIRRTNYLNTRKVIFKIKDENGKKTRIDPSEVKTIRSIKGLDGNCYITTIYGKWFLKKIIDGRIKVYQLIDGVIIFVSKDNSEIVSTDVGWFFSGKKAHEQIRPLLEDDEEVLKQFDSISGNYKNIMSVIKKYNENNSKLLND
ncbi:MAG: hypothetical protein P8K68_13150 [Algibacter sp.]|uniref:hypothetical protein n=1 Tax=Algibacter sp. TaxID=1872428 RepID=UPI002617FC02|nr:hypothetical protein [Algibacter sp.]MDG1730492.1 hypothetical protein [Algibacter sp.]MDG2179714.1 hypothetical protein [Algibacter sp.]